MNSTGKQILSGVFYTAIAKYAGIVVSLAVTAVLSRLLSPDDFAIVAIATVIITFFAIFSDMGIAPAIIQRHELDKRDLSNIFSFTVWGGVVIAALFFFSATYVARYYEAPILIPICRLLSVNLLFATFNIVPNALLTRDKRFRFIAVRTLAVQTVCGVAAIVAALRGAGLYALLVNPILSSVILFAISYWQYPQRLRLSLGIGSVRKIFSYSFFQFSFNVINYFSRNLDKLIIGKYIGKTPLGYYEKSYRLMMLPLQNITQVVSPVMHPIFADFQNDVARQADNYAKVVRVLAFIGFPLSALFYFIAPELILLLFGNQWTAAIPVFKILSLSVGIQIILSTSGSMFQAANSTKVMFYSGLLSTLLTVAGLLVAVFRFGTIEAVAWSVVVTFAINFLQCYLLLYKITYRLPMHRFWMQMPSALILTAVEVSCLLPLAEWCASLPMVISLIIKGCAFVVVWAAYIQLSGEFDIVSKAESLIRRK